MDKFQEEKIKELYKKRRPLKLISKETNLSTKKIKEWLIENELWTGHNSLRKFFNEFYFDKIDTEEKAYWLGFFYADGYLTTNRNTVGIELKSDDINQLEKFKKSLEIEHEIKIYKKQSTFGPQENCRLCFSSAHMKKILSNYFGTVHKTQEGIIPILYDEKLMWHMIRGVFDGDGTLTWTKKEEGNILCPNLSITNTKETLEIIEKYSNFNWNWYQRHPDSKINNWTINCGRVNDNLSFLKNMYDNANIYLDRKYSLYKELIDNRNKYYAKARV